MTETLTINLDQFLPYSPARVWKALTDSALLARWFMPNDFQLKVGHRFTFQGTPMPSVKFGGTAYCEVLDFEPERFLSLSWADRGGNGLSFTVTWRLEPEQNGTRLFLEHTGFDANNQLSVRSHQIMSKGWLGVQESLEKFLASLEPEVKSVNA
ncbi:SRPBCC domain-containing protein [Ktedonosporobacter rubrisoli]|uniref:SRPBCC domain-containing protein n=1 Tax=Ktedonosporobacter rubrisoli TaxID=2509675 RepID=A0A4P6JLF6_KTERU|nr:SRPBCC domain-containing protein [Ktedonosporobacter rubrisoli]QBD76049.1 SRPBCC domain-containing protein [Ktedonosporobacter rubrisoli]